MKVYNCRPVGIINLLVGMLIIISLLPAKADQSDPNGSVRAPEPGWSLWRPKAEIQDVDFTSGFSNLELGGYLDFEAACSRSAGIPNSELTYWFRLSNLVEQIGTGKVEYGCWMNGHFLYTQTSTAIKGNVNCLQVNTPTVNGLRIRSSPSIDATVVGFVRNGATVKPDGSPAWIQESDGRNWVAISSPVQGWVSNDSPDSRGNLALCRR